MPSRGTFRVCPALSSHSRSSSLSWPKRISTFLMVLDLPWRRGAGSCGLPRHQAREHPAHRGELLVGALLDDAAVVDDVDAVRVGDGAQAVGDQHPRRLEALEAAADDLLGPVVEGAGRLVEEHDAGPANEGGGDEGGRVLAAGVSVRA